MDGVALDYVGDLNSRKDFWNIKARVIKMWKQNFRWDMILIDERGSKIQAIVKNHLTPQFEHVLKEDSVLVIRKFGVADQKDHHIVINLKHKINFFKCTNVVTVPTFNGHPYGFNFVSFNDINGGKLGKALTVDVIGRMAWCSDLEIFRTGGKESKRVNLELQYLEGNVLKCTLWSAYAEQMNSFVASNQSKEMIILVIQHGRPKEWGGQKTVQNDRYATRVFVNEELSEVNDFRRSMILKDGPSSSQHVLSSQTSYPVRDEFVNKTPRKHVDELIEVDTVANLVHSLLS